MDARVEKLHILLSGLPRCAFQTPKETLPSDGIYFFFERGEYVSLGGRTVDRVVRVGTHREDDRFPARIRQHYGNKHSLGGNKNGSVFRKHLGGALLRREDPGDPRITEWITQGGESYSDVEEAVSRELRSNFTFVWVAVPTREARLSLESGLIALLAQFPAAAPSRSWLGGFAVDSAIRASGLWNTQPLKSPALDRDGLVHLQTLAGGREEEKL
jgi:hypothetical protein